MVEYCSCCTYMHSFCHLLRITVSLMQTCTWICRQLFDILFYGFEKANKLSSFILLNRKTLKLVFKQLGVWQINFFFIFYHFTGIRDSCTYLHDQDWLKLGHMAHFGFLLNQEEDESCCRTVQATHGLVGDLHNATAVLYGLKQKLKSARYSLLAVLQWSVHNLWKDLCILQEQWNLMNSVVTTLQYH